MKLANILTEKINIEQIRKQTTEQLSTALLTFYHPSSQSLNTFLNLAKNIIWPKQTKQQTQSKIDLVLGEMVVVFLRVINDYIEKKRSTSKPQVSYSSFPQLRIKSTLSKGLLGIYDITDNEIVLSVPMWFLEKLVGLELSQKQIKSYSDIVTSTFLHEFVHYLQFSKVPDVTKVDFGYKNYIGYIKKTYEIEAFAAMAANQLFSITNDVDLILNMLKNSKGHERLSRMSNAFESYWHHINTAPLGLTAKLYNRFIKKLVQHLQQIEKT